MHAQSTPTLEADAPGFGEYLGIVRKRRSLVFKIGLPIVAIASLLAIGLPDVYRSSGLIEIEEDAKQTVGQNPRNGETPYADQYVQSLSTAVLSDKSLRQLLSTHQLYDDQ